MPVRAAFDAGDFRDVRLDFDGRRRLCLRFIRRGRGRTLRGFLIRAGSLEPLLGFALPDLAEPQVFADLDDLGALRAGGDPLVLALLFVGFPLLLARVLFVDPPLFSFRRALLFSAVRLGLLLRDRDDGLGVDDLLFERVLRDIESVFRCVDRIGEDLLPALDVAAPLNDQVAHGDVVLRRLHDDRVRPLPDVVEALLCREDYLVGFNCLGGSHRLSLLCPALGVPSLRPATSVPNFATSSSAGRLRSRRP